MSGITLIDDVSPLLARVRSAAAARGLAMVAARAVRNQVREHLFALNTARHRYGRNYYAQAARGVGVVERPNGAAVTVTQQGLRQRLLGGTIKARKKYLTIPARQEAYGKRASEIPGLHFAMVATPDGGLAPALVKAVSQALSFVRRKQADGSYAIKGVRPGEVAGGEVYFWLRRQVTQRADPTVLPPVFELAATSRAAINERLERLISRTTNGGAAL